MEALEFDGLTDSLYHPYREGAGSMEFLKDHGAFDDVPYDFVISTMRSKHPNFLSDSGTGTVAGGRLADEAK
jgi:hypothetical protein